jgi:tetratricopeptide (TPR) repeat protein
MRRARLMAVAVLVMAAPRMAPGQMPLQFAASHADSASAAALARADRAYAAQRWREAADLYQGALAVRDGDPRRWWALGHALYNDRRHRESIAAYERALQLGAGDPAIGAWQIARAYALEGNGKQALRWLQHAMSAGLDDREAIRSDPAFGPYRDDPRFSELVDGPRSKPASTLRPEHDRAATVLTAERAYRALGRQGSNLQLPG